MVRSTEEFRGLLKAARRAGTPLLAIRTADPATAIAQVTTTVGEKSALLQWDLMTGIRGINRAGVEIVADRFGENTTLGPADVLASTRKLENEDAVLFLSNTHRFWDQPDVVQAIWNVRDPFKSGGQSLVLLSTPGAILPAELQNDVMVIDEPLPSANELTELVMRLFEDAELEVPGDATLSACVDALIGLAAFPAEQVLALALSKNGVDLERLWERKRQAVEQTPGLSIWRGGETFDDIGGCETIKRFLSAVLHGKDAPRVIVFVDEIEKAFAGTGTDLSGVKTEMTGTMLSWMQDANADGIVLIGPPGAAKSAIAKAAGNSAGIPTVAFDLSAMQSGIVGGSGERLRTALQVVDAISQGRSLWIATCNSIGSLPPELRRRFTLGTFFFDLPSAEEREAIWRIYRAKWNLDGATPKDEGWTGAEIKECCRKAWRLNLSLTDSAQYIVPVARSAGDQIERLRQQASGRFLSASHPGVYESGKDVPAIAGKRMFREVSD
jgi:hypothetical protein